MDRFRTDAFLPLTPVAFEILLALADGERHGYSILQEVETRTGGAVALHAGTLYRALARLLESALIEELDAPPDRADDDERRRYLPAERPRHRGGASRSGAPGEPGLGGARAPPPQGSPRVKPRSGGRLRSFLFSLALLAYPRAFRRHFGAEMRADFKRAPSLRTVVALVPNGLAERMAAIARWSFWPGHQPHMYEPTRSRTMVLGHHPVRRPPHAAPRAQVPGSNALAVLALALGIGANSAIFTVVYSVLLRPLPYSDPARLVMVWSHNTREDKPNNPISPADFADLRDQSKSLVTLEGYFSFMTSSKLTVDGQAEIAVTNAVTPGLFTMMGRAAALGRALTPDEPDGHLVLSDGFWRRRFGADRGIIGRAVTVDDQPFTIVGVMPPDFIFPYKGMLGPSGFTRSLNADFWVPLQFTGPQFVSPSGQLVRTVHFLAAVGRLQPGVSVEQARAGLATVASQLEQSYPDSNRGWTTTVIPLHEQVVGEVRPALLMLIGGVALVLLMACVNVANLVLARSVSRQKELAVRAALGASRGRLAAQALTESLLLALGGATLGLVAVTWGVQALVALAPANLPRLQEVSPDLTVLGVTLLVAIATGTLVGIVPALVAGRADVHHALQDASRGMVGSALPPPHALGPRGRGSGPRRRPHRGRGIAAPQFRQAARRRRRIPVRQPPHAADEHPFTARHARRQARVLRHFLRASGSDSRRRVGRWHDPHSAGLDQRVDDGGSRGPRHRAERSAGSGIPPRDAQLLHRHGHSAAQGTDLHRRGRANGSPRRRHQPVDGPARIRRRGSRGPAPAPGAQSLGPVDDDHRRHR